MIKPSFHSCPNELGYFYGECVANVFNLQTGQSYHWQSKWILSARRYWLDNCVSSDTILQYYNIEKAEVYIEIPDSNNFTKPEIINLIIDKWIQISVKATPVRVFITRYYQSTNVRFVVFSSDESNLHHRCTLAGYTLYELLK